MPVINGKTSNNDTTLMCKRNVTPFKYQQKLNACDYILEIYHDIS